MSGWRQRVEKLVWSHRKRCRQQYTVFKSSTYVQTLSMYTIHVDDSLLMFSTGEAKSTASQFPVTKPHCVSTVKQWKSGKGDRAMCIFKEQL